jgi:hypothetical protein
MLSGHSVPRNCLLTNKRFIVCGEGGEERRIKREEEWLKEEGTETNVYILVFLWALVVWEKRFRWPRSYLCDLVPRLSTHNYSKLLCHRHSSG